MDPSMKIIKPNETTKLLEKMNTIGFLCGFKDIWVTEVKLSKRFINIYTKVDYVMDILYLLITLSILGSFFTQKNLSEKQANDRLIFSIMFPGHFFLNYIPLFYKQKNRNLLYHLAVVLKEHQNDAALEREMIKKIKMISVSLSGLISMVIIAYGFRGLYQVIIAGENFITLITAWPDIKNTSTAAGVMRVFFYLWWFTIALKAMYAYVMIISTLLLMCYQFKNLQNYFYSLDGIFGDKALSHEEKEVKYEAAFKLGIHMHSLTLWCKKQHQHVSKEIFAIEIVLFFGMLLSQLITLLGGERNLTQLLTLFIMSSATCLTLGLFMCNGGDVTVEAAKLSEAIYRSGWENCYGQSSIRIRKLVVNAMRKAQDPVVYKTLGVVEFSYASYVTLVRMPYSAVSVFY